jgi:hypothetical protein
LAGDSAAVNHRENGAFKKVITLLQINWQIDISLEYSAVENRDVSLIYN